jgi:hypothetical protein
MMGAEFLEHCTHVNLHRALGELEGAPYLLVGHALGHQAQNVSLTAGQCLEWLSRMNSSSGLK